MKHLFIILSLLLLCSCRTPQKTSSDLQYKNDLSIKNDIELSEETYFNELTERIINRLQKDRLNISIQKTLYDTDKPADPSTGNHPVKEETNIQIKQETEKEETDSTHSELLSESSVDVDDNYRIEQKGNLKSSQQSESGLSSLQKFLMAVGIVAFICLAFFIYSKLK